MKCKTCMIVPLVFLDACCLLSRPCGTNSSAVPPTISIIDVAGTQTPISKVTNSELSDAKIPCIADI